MTDFFDTLYSNEQLKSYIALKVSENALPHAIIFEGARGSGKLSIAKMTAQSLSPEYAEKIGRLATPDVTLHQPEDGKKSIGVGTVREIREAAYIKPQELNIRVFIIRYAHLMTTEAQNALLKILEEPPKNVYFFLLCENASLLLPTVRSRAPVLKTSVISDDELADYMAQSNKQASDMQKSSPDEYKMLIRSCSGSIGIATERLGAPSDDSERLSSQTLELVTLLSGGKRDKALLFFIKNKFTRESLSSLLLMFSCAMRDMLKIKYGEPDNFLYFVSCEEAENLSAAFTRLTLMNLYTASEQLRDKLSVNVNIDAYRVLCADVLSDTARK